MPGEYYDMLSHLENIQIEINGLRKEMKKKTEVVKPVEAPSPVVKEIPVMSHKKCEKLGCPNPQGVGCKNRKKLPCDDVPGCVLAATGKHGNTKGWSVCRSLTPSKKMGGRRRTRRRKRKRTRKKKNKKRRRTKKKRRRRR
tara:strand:+ start:1071 stop:1493 length:423 start_codon:yes stop_codon:yes gene_type:complete